MELHHLKEGKKTVLELVPTRGETFPAVVPDKAPCRVFLEQGGTDCLLQLMPTQGTWPGPWEVKGASRSQKQALSALVEAGLPQLAWVVACANPPQAGKTQTHSSSTAACPRQLTLEVHTFGQHLILDVPLELGMQEYVQDQLRKDYLKGQATEEALCRYLEDELLLPSEGPGKPKRAILCASPDTVLAAEGAFRVLGRSLSVDVRRTKAGIALIEKVTRSRPPRREDARPQLILEGSICCVDRSQAGAFRGQVAQALEQLVEKGESYLALWKKYNELEEMQLIRKLLDFTWLPYEKWFHSAAGSWVFTLKSQESGLHTLAQQLQRIRMAQEDGFSLEASVKLPTQLMEQVNQSRQSHAPDLAPQLLAEAEPLSLDAFTNKGQESQFLGVYEAHREQAGKEGMTLQLELRPSESESEAVPPKLGFLFVSPVGDRVRIQRRKRAEASIRLVQNPMVQLAPLLEGQAVSIAKYKHVKSMSAEARKRFKSEPTPAQRLALDLGCNTPDILLIQGPPGSGKTQVIAALSILLAEHQENITEIRGSTLITSFQHDAVEEASSRTQVLGLPAVKVGKRAGDVASLDPHLTWRTKQIETLEARFTPTPESKYVRLRAEVSELASVYRQFPGKPASWAPKLFDLYDRLVSYLPADLQEELLLLAERLKLTPRPEMPDPARQALLKAVRSLRVQEKTFEDDGTHQAGKLLVRIARGELSLEPKEQALLERARDAGAGPWDFLPALADLQAKLLDDLTPVELPPVQSAAHPEVEALLPRLVQALCEHEMHSKSGIEAAQLLYLEDLKEDPQGVTRALADYTAVLAATTQQAVGTQMRLAKDVVADRSQTLPQFETVIVDEAARANPMDLLIPMALAKRRIILVGDHKQLPHLLEPDLEREFERTASAQVQAQLKLSLFQHLYELLKAREAQDGVCRTILLDTQFRMHPSLGAFVSEHFYEKQLKSVRPAAEFRHDLPGYGTTSWAEGSTRPRGLKVSSEGCMAWLEVPLREGLEQSGQSKARRVEARAIVRELKRLMDACDRSADETQRSLTFGVITFYSAQVEELWEALYAEKLAERQGNRDVIRAPYALLENKSERLRIGTVDAFQGKEFDVVFLSMTRANRRRSEEEDRPATEQELRRRFGHLMLPNRVNVAMSRQKRLLIVAGAPELVTEADAARAIPALPDFYSRCTQQRSSAAQG